MSNKSKITVEEVEYESIASAARAYSINYRKVCARMKVGVPVDIAFNTPADEWCIIMNEQPTTDTDYFEMKEEERKKWKH
jgi:hypothetical protein